MTQRQRASDLMYLLLLLNCLLLFVVLVSFNSRHSYDCHYVGMTEIWAYFAISMSERARIISQPAAKQAKQKVYESPTTSHY
jgi:hypothetical protein